MGFPPAAICIGSTLSSFLISAFRSFFMEEAGSRSPGLLVVDEPGVGPLFSTFMVGFISKIKRLHCLICSRSIDWLSEL